MCLASRRKTAKVATEDIICYKFAIIRKNQRLSPFQLTPYMIGEVMEDKGEVEINESISDKKYYIGKGMFHSFAHLSDAADRRYYFQALFNMMDEYCIYKCIIPKGTKYYEGTFAYNIWGYASRSLLIAEEIKMDV